MIKECNVLKFILVLGDVFLLYTALFMAESIRHGTLAVNVNITPVFLHFTFIYIFWILLLYIFDFYEFAPNDSIGLARNFTAFILSALFAGVLYFYFRPQVGISPKTILVLDVFIFGILVLGWRYAFGRIFNIGYREVLQDPKRVVLEGIDDEKFSQNYAQDKRYDVEKKVTDLFFAVIGVVFFAVFFPVIALAIKQTSRGPIFYSQRRIGRGGKSFTLYKFRTMVQDAEQNGPQWAQKKDVRVTKVGLFLRCTHLDELPQVLNLLKGEISLVGPRPERPEFVRILEKEIAHYRLREVVKPGIFGWAQLNFPYGDSVEDAREKLKYDLYYIQNQSLFFDMAIVLKSLKIILFARGQ